jgi:NAD(P)-dependent dehydrogenase (short-subunit alcohol dehydrogenase family)
MLTRRRVLLGGLGVAAVGAAAAVYTKHVGLWGGRWAGEQLPPPPGVPVGPFGVDSTAEEVTEGIDLGGKTVLITGVTSGLGLETMRVLALRGAHVIGTGRTLEKARAACASVRGHTTPLVLELTDWPSVVACANAVRTMATSLDILVCNAGVMGLRTLEQVNGIERHFATNHLGHFLLTASLMDRLKVATQGRVVVVSSAAMAWADPQGIEWDNLSGDRHYDPRLAYGQSKLANALFSFGLAKRLADTPATSNALHPGYVDTNLFRHYPLSLKGYNGILTGNKIPVEEGAATSCYVATAPALATVSGHFFRECNPVIPDPRATDADAADRLWQVSEQLLKPYL